MYLLYKFGDYELPNWNPKDDLSTAEARPSFYEYPDSRLDYYRIGRVPLVPINISKSVDLYQEEDYLDLRALVGKREKLYRKLDSDDSLQWNYARFLQLRHNREYVRDKCRISVDMEFALLNSAWYSETPRVISETIDASVDTFSLPNNGNYPVTNAIIEITAPSGFGPDIVTFGFSVGTDYRFRWSGTMSSGDILTINTGSRSVKLNDVSSYNEFSLQTTHKANDWLLLEPGSNTLTITNSKSTGDISVGMWHGTRVIPTYSDVGDITISDFIISITYYDAWL